MASRSTSTTFQDDILSIALAAEAQGLADACEGLAQLLMKRWLKLSKSSKRLEIVSWRPPHFEHGALAEWMFKLSKCEKETRSNGTRR